MDITELLGKWKLIDTELVERIEEHLKSSAVLLADRDMSAEKDSKGLIKLFALNGIDIEEYFYYWETVLFEQGKATVFDTTEIQDGLEHLEQEYSEVFHEKGNSIFPQLQKLLNVFSQDCESSTSIKERLMEKNKHKLSIGFPMGKTHSIESRELTFELLVALSKRIQDDSIPPFLSPDFNPKATESLPQNETSFGMIHKTYLVNLIGIITMSSALGEIKYHEDRVKAVNDIVKNVYFKNVQTYYNGKLLSQRSVERLLLQMK